MAGWQRRDEMRDAGHRHRHADDRGDGHGRNARPADDRGEGGNRRHDCIRSAADRAAARRRRRSSPAIRLAAGQALETLFAKVAPTLGVDASTLVAANGRIQVKDNPSKGLAWRDACKLLGTEPIAADAQWQAGLSATGTSGVQFTEVKVDVETGIVKVERILAIQDCGLVVDKLTAESQVYGGIIGSLNFALFEDRILDRVTGQMVNPNMEWYLLAGHVRRAEDRNPSEESAGARRDRHRRTADGVDGVGHRQRCEKCHRRDDSQPAAHASEGARRDRAAESWRDAVKAFAYVNPTNEKEAVPALKFAGGVAHAARPAARICWRA